MKYIILVGDGMGDHPIAALDGHTPLEKANTPAMDFLAANGELFLARTIPQGYPPGSDVANLSLLGYLPQACYSGRAPLEAASMGVALADDEIACRCNLVTIEESDGRIKMLDYSAGHISTAEAKVLIDALEQKLGNGTRHFYAGVSYRHLLVIKGQFVAIATVPPHDHTGREVTSYWQDYLAHPQLKDIVEPASRLLAGHAINQARLNRGERPANGIWLWGEGKAPAMPTLYDQFGVRGALISAVDLLKGLGVYAGMDIIQVEGATGYLDTNYQGKADAALAALADHDLVFVHVEAPDEAGHQGLVREKIQAIEDFDQKIVRPILEGVRRFKEFRLMVAMDHFTPIAIKTHVDQPVPVLIYDSRGSKKMSGLAYTEKDAAGTGLIIDDGRKLLEKLLEKGDGLRDY